MCRREHGLTWNEFAALTLAELEALEERRDIALRHARFNAALVTSAIYNAHRSPDSLGMSPFDLIPGCEESPEDVERDKVRRSVKQAIRLALTEMRGKTPEDVQAERCRMIDNMTAQGIEDPEGLMQDAWPDL